MTATATTPAGRGLLAGMRAIVTGASRGIGAAIARRLAAEGAVVGAITRAPLDRRPGSVVERTIRAGRCADLGDAAATRAAVEALAAELGGLDVLVNNAGTTVRADALALSPEAFDRVLGVNLRGAFVAAQAAARAMGDGGGAIVNVASLSARFGIRRGAAYGASKGGIVQLTKALALEWGPRGIRVNAVAPGYIATDLTGPLLADERRRRAIEARIPLGRWGTPDDVAGAVALLCSPLAAYVSGEVLFVDGGYSADG